MHNKIAPRFYLTKQEWFENKLNLCLIGRGRTNAFGVYIGHRICHRVLATSATLLSRPDIIMPEGPKDQKSRCPALSNGTLIKSKIPSCSKTD